MNSSTPRAHSGNKMLPETSKKLENRPFHSLVLALPPQLHSPELAVHLVLQPKGHVGLHGNHASTTLPDYKPVEGEDEEREHEKSIEAMKFREGGGSRMGMETMREGESLSQ